MCGRYCIKESIQTISTHFAVDSIENDFQWQPQYNLSPGQGIPVIFEDRDAETRRLSPFLWGFIPEWSLRSQQKLSPSINARIETASHKPSFKSAYRYRRCLIPANGWFEWKGKGALKEPHYLFPENGDLIGLAGLWEYLIYPDGSELYSVCILTRKANQETQSIHPRMPLIIAPDQYDDWLSPDSPSPPEIAFQGKIRNYPVDFRVNSRMENDPSLIEASQRLKQSELF